MYASTKQGNGESVRKQGNDRWEPFKGVYPDPTPDEYELISPFLDKYALEDDDFDEDADEEFVFLKERYGHHVRHLFIEFLRQVRESKGYDVTLGFAFIESPFFPKKNTEEGMDAALVAMEEINTQTIPSGKAYKFVSLDKYVWAYSRRYLLTIRAKENLNPNAMEIDEGDGADAGAQDDDLEKTIQAMVFEPYPDEYELIEWKFKADSSA